MKPDEIRALHQPLIDEFKDRTGASLDWLRSAVRVTPSDDMRPPWPVKQLDGGSLLITEFAAIHDAALVEWLVAEFDNNPPAFHIASEYLADEVVKADYKRERRKRQSERSEGGKERSNPDYSPENLQKKINEKIKKNPALSLTQARKRCAKETGASLSTFKRKTHDPRV